MPSLVVNKDTGELLFDTSRICYGLVKSAYLAAGEVWQRRVLRSVTNDPDQGGSYIDSTRAGDQMFTITVNNPRSPIVFLVGKGCLQGTSISGATMTFHFSAASTATKAYVFDLMADNIAGSPYLKTFTDQAVCTFNSLQPPLNVVAAVQAPAPGAADAWSRRPLPYAGGSWQAIRTQTASVDFQSHFVVDVPLGQGIEYAACLPWSRGASGFIDGSLTGVNAKVIGFSEGAYGRTDGISFIFAPAGATSSIDLSSNQYSLPGSLANLPLDRYPQALVVPTANLPFPYN
ncbi:hypothetical protein CCL16_10610 [Pseudomonas syringae]|uniref:hypothetical protein n=1 Tax=Pseudomonas TaxID=286 RepID=UPI000BB5A65C|nr:MULTISPECIES: hypothetical protein [Pseudomonas]PBP84841.1 hypothetical protein CCL16_15750 [Pseudomonas syringae]PBP88957.1 hypothetical protein CCL16_10610 [Pseudomonas syringae]